jgi:integrase/recombinase XerC
VRDLLTAARNVRSNPKKPRLELARLRNIAMLEALRSGGMRVGELVGLKRDDVDYRQHSARVTGKGNKQRIIYFDDKAWNAISHTSNPGRWSQRSRALSAPSFRPARPPRCQSRAAIDN